MYKKYAGHCACLLSVFALAHAAFAVNPQFGQILPRGGQRGTEVPVTISGSGLADAVDVLFHATGLTFKDVEVVDDANVKATLVVAPDCPLGTQPLRIHTKTGVSNIQLFSVGALKEVQEAEPNNPAEQATPAELNTTINGVITSEDVDYYTVDLAESQRFAVEVEGLRLGKVLFDPKLRFFDPTGNELLAEDDTQLFRQDPGFSFTAPTAGKYTIAVSDASYGGNGDSIYRLHLGTFPLPLSVTPLGGSPGETVEVTWLGDAGLGAQQVVVPAVDEGTGSLPVTTEIGLAPTNMPFRVVSLPDTREVEPNNEVAQATPGTAPGAFEGVLAEAGDQDCFQFAATPNSTYEVRVWARALGSPLDSVLTILAPSGGAAGSDDDAAGIDSLVRITTAEEGNYTLLIQDHLKRGGANFSYRVEVSPVQAKLSTKLLENRPASITVPQDNQSYLLVNVARADFDAPIKINLLDLPSGVAAASEVLPAGQTTLPVILSAAADAPAGAGLARVQGVQDVPENPVQGDLDQEVVLIFGQNETTFFGLNVNRLATAVSEPAPFKVELVAPTVPIVHGGARMLTVKATRAEGFTTPIDLRFPWLPPGMSGGTAQIPGDQTTTEIRLEVSGGAAVAVHNIFVAASAAGWQLCTPFTPVEVQQPWVSLQLAAASTDQGKPTEMVVAVTQRQPFEGSFPVVLNGLPKDVTTEPQQITKDTTELKFPLNVAADSPAGKFESVFAQFDVVVNNEPVTHVMGGGVLSIFEPLPATLQAAAPAPEAAPDQPAAPARKTRFPTS